MPSSRVRVVPVYQARGLLPLAAAVGIAGGVLAAASSQYGHLIIMHVMNRLTWAPPWVESAAEMLFDLSPIVLPPVLVALLLCRVHQGRRRSLVAGATVMAALMLTVLPVSHLADHSGGARQGLNFPRWGMLVAFAVAVGYGLLAGLTVHWLVRSAAFVTAEQTGTLCWRCGYDLGSAALTACPECAEPAAPGRFRGRRKIALIGWLHRRGRAALILAAPAVVLWSAHRIVTLTLPSHRFLEGLDPGGGEVRWGTDLSRRFDWMYINADWRTRAGGWFNPWTWDGIGVLIPIAGDPARAIGYAYWPRGAHGAEPWVRMRVFIADPPVPVTAPGAGPGIGAATITFLPSPAEGTVRVFADLDAAQAAAVIAARGAPASLRAGLLAKAAEVGWARDPANLSGPNYNAGNAWVQADGHFPE